MEYIVVAEIYLETLLILFVSSKKKFLEKLVSIMLCIAWKVMCVCFNMCVYVSVWVSVSLHT